jgi:hypothetical protein
MALKVPRSQRVLRRPREPKERSPRHPVKHRGRPGLLEDGYPNKPARSPARHQRPHARGTARRQSQRPTEGKTAEALTRPRGALVTLLDTGEHTGGEVTELFGVARATVYRANNAPDATTQHLPSDRRAAAQDCRYPPKGEASPSRFGAVRLLLIRGSGGLIA